jgi:hypothetical protein
MAKSKTKATNLKKSLKSNKKKFSLKNLDFKKNWKKLSYLGLSGFLVVASLGYAGWDHFRQKDASAFSPVRTYYVTPTEYVTLYMCKYSVSAGGYAIGSFMNNRSSYNIKSNWSTTYGERNISLLYANPWSKGNSDYSTINAATSNKYIYYTIGATKLNISAKSTSGSVLVSSLVTCPTYAR